MGELAENFDAVHCCLQARQDRFSGSIDSIGLQIGSNYGRKFGQGLWILA